MRGQLTSNNITSFTTDANSNILIGTYGGGILRQEGNRFVPLYSDHDILRYVKAIASDRHGALWVGTVDKGVVRIAADGKQFTNFRAPNSPLYSDGIMCLAYDAPGDRLYIGTTAGVAVYDCAHNSFINDVALDSLRDVNVTSILVDESGKVWIGSRNGLWVKRQNLVQITTDQGLTNNVIRALAMGNGSIWATTDNGLTNITFEDDGYVGKSPVEFIRIIRLKRAKSFLDQGRTNISEVADKVGFSPKMLAQYFRETYGYTPSEYLKNKKSKNK